MQGTQNRHRGLKHKGLLEKCKEFHAARRLEREAADQLQRAPYTAGELKGYHWGSE